MIFPILVSFFVFAFKKITRPSEEKNLFSTKSGSLSADRQASFGGKKEEKSFLKNPRGVFRLPHPLTHLPLPSPRQSLSSPESFQGRPSHWPSGQARNMSRRPSLRSSGARAQARAERGIHIPTIEGPEAWGFGRL